MVIACFGGCEVLNLVGGDLWRVLGVGLGGGRVLGG